MGPPTSSRNCDGKGQIPVKIAVTTENGMIFQHFGKCQEFTVYETEDGRILSRTTLSSGGNGHSALATLLAQNNVGLLICGGIGGGAKNALAAAGVQLVAGASGSVDAAVEAFLAGTLIHDADFTCDHHGHGEAHSCGEHDSHDCGGHCSH